jgi:hypothetical protein
MSMGYVEKVVALVQVKPDIYPSNSSFVRSILYLPRIEHTLQ